MKKSLLLLLCFVLTWSLFACESASQPSISLPDNLGISSGEEALTEEEATEKVPTVTTEEQPSTEEEQTQISQMDKNQVSKTYTYLKDLFGDAVYYLNYTAQTVENRQTVKKDTIIASNGSAVYIEEKHAGYAYLVKNGTVTVMNTKERSYTSYDITGSEFTLENYIDWHRCEEYLGKEFTSVSAGTRSRPKLTETFQEEGRSISFYYYKNVLNTVSGTDASGEQWSITVKSAHNEPKAALFEIPAKYLAKSADGT